ncbi:MAG: DUF3298 domain-containing protein [Lachnospiraceae bacterium]|nr:DUF3298 domain-containing protein [Lachnospiraceae bacterium]
MKKKVLSFALTFTLALSMAGCAQAANSPKETGTEAPEKVTEAASEPVKEETEAAVQETEEMPYETESEPQSAAVDSDEAPQGISRGIYLTDSQEEPAFNFVNLNVQGITLSEESREAYPTLYDALDKAWKEDASEAKERLADLGEQARTEYQDRMEYDETAEGMRPYAYETKVSITRSDPRVFSVCSSFFEDTGGVHGMYGNFGKTYDSATGETLTLSDVITDTKAFGEALFEKVEKEYPDVVDYLESPEDIRTQIIEEVSGSPETWALEPDGIVYFFNPYDIAAYAAGEQIIKIGYAEKPEIFAAGYLPVEGFDYIGGLPNGKDVLIDLDGDGAIDRVELYTVEEPSEWDPEMYEMVGINARVNGEKEFVLRDDEWEMFGFDAEIARFASGKTYLLLSIQELNDYMSLSVIDITNGSFSKVEDYGLRHMYEGYDEETDSYGEYMMTNTRSLYLTEHFDELSTYEAGSAYYLTEDGEIRTDAVYAVIGERDREHLTLKSLVPLTGDIVDEEGTVVEKDASFEAGTEFVLYRVPYSPVDGKKFVDSLLSDGRIARLYYENNEICGVNEWDAFETLYYAG